MTTNSKIFKKIISSRVFIATVFTVIGMIIAATTAYTMANNKKYDPFDDGLLSIHNDIFKEMIETQKRMDKIFYEQQKRFDEAFKENKNVSKTSVSTKEDKDNYYYELYFTGFKKEDIIVKIKDDIITFSAIKNDEKNKSQSNFYYSFLAGQYDKNKEPEIIRNDDNIIVKLLKKR